MKSLLLPLISLVITCIVWGVDFIMIQIALENINPIFLAFIRLATASIALLSLHFIIERKKTIESCDWKYVIATGAIGMGLYFFIENIGIQHTSGSLAALILATIPIMGLIADRIFYKAKFTLAKTIAIILSVIGVVIIVTGGSAESIEGRISGYLFMIGATSIWTLYIVMSKPLFEKYSLLLIISYQTLSGAVILLPFALFKLPPPDSFTPSIIGIILFVSLICTAAATFTYAYSIAHLTVTTVAAFENIIPVISVITSYILFKETLAVQQLLGGAIIIFSVAWVSIVASKYSAS